MELTLDRDAAVTAMSKAQGVVMRTTTIPILRHVWLGAGPGGLSIRACDQVMEATATAAAEVAKPGQTTVAGQRLHDLLRALPAGGQLAMQLSEDGSRLTVKCGRSRFQLPTLPVADFPTFETGKATHQATLPAKALAQIIDKVAFAQNRDQSRYYLCGVYLHTIVLEGVTWLRAVATDGSRLGYAQVEAPEGWAAAPGVVLPTKTISEARSLLEGLAGDVEMWTDGNLWGLEAGGALLSSKLVDGSYPDYVRVIPQDPAEELALDVTELSAALKRCGIMAEGKTRPARLAISAESVMLRSRDGEGGEVEEQLSADYAGEARELSFNCGYLAELAAQMSGETMRLGLGSPADPIRVTDPLTSGSVYVVMPLRV